MIKKFINSFQKKDDVRRGLEIVVSEMRDGDTVFVFVRGVTDIGDANKLKETIKKEIKKDVGVIVVNADEVEIKVVR